MYERTYHSKVLKQNAPPEKKRRKRFAWKKATRWSMFVLVVVGIAVLIRLPTLQVRDIAVVGTSVADPQDVSQFVRSKIEGRYLYLFPKSSMLLVPTTSLAKWTAHAFPRFAKVDIRRKGIHDLIVTVSEYQGAYLWCETAADDTPCFFMTDRGLVFAPAPFFSGDAYTKMVMGTRQELPFSPLTEEQLAMVQLLSERLPVLGIVPVEFHTVSEHEVDVIFFHNGTRATLMVDPANEYENMLEDLATGLATEPLKKQFNDSKRTLEYLDARFANKVVYKFK